jgi:DNA modification methylase
MKIVPLIAIQIAKDRQRQLNTKKDIPLLALSIETLGNLQRPGVWSGPDGMLLVWGERRYRAILALADQGKSYRIADGTEIPLGSIAVDEVDADLTLSRSEREFDENVQRVDLAWPDRVRALAAIHEARKAANPKQTVIQTAREISAKTGIPVDTLRHQAVNSAGGGAINSIPTALILAPHLSDPEVQRATSIPNALAIVTRKREEAATAALVKRREARGVMAGELARMRHGDCRVLMKELDSSTVDLILVDPPYGVSADQPNFSRRQAQKHTYSDDPKESRELMQFLLLEGFRVAKERANLFMFFDSKHMSWLYEAAMRALWSPFPVPIIWDKMSAGIGPWQNNGFGRSYEMIFFATKGRRGLHTWARDVLSHKRVPSDERRHSAQKPDSLLRELISISTMPGEFVLDPCAGSGTTLVAARALSRRSLGFELDKALYDGAVTNLFGPGAAASRPGPGAKTT